MLEQCSPEYLHRTGRGKGTGRNTARTEFPGELVAQLLGAGRIVPPSLAMCLTKFGPTRTNKGRIRDSLRMLKVLEVSEVAGF